jgi:hypothetical protein
MFDDFTIFLRTVNIIDHCWRTTNDDQKHPNKIGIAGQILLCYFVFAFARATLSYGYSVAFGIPINAATHVTSKTHKVLVV